MGALAVAALAITALLLWRIVRDDSNQIASPCGAPTPTETPGALALGPLELRGFADEATVATAERRLGQVLLLAHRDEGPPEPLELTAADCATETALTLLAIGSRQPISIPPSFPDTAGSRTVTVAPEHSYVVVVVFGDRPGPWRLTARGDRTELGAVVFRLRPATG